MPTDRPLRFVPPRGVLVLLALPLLAFAWLQVNEVSGDGGIDNALSFVAAVAFGLIYGLWFFFFSGLTGRGRVALVGLGLALGVFAYAAVRIDGWSGANVPALRFAWNPKPAPELEGGTITAAAGVDLATTTPDDFPGFLGPDRSAALPNVRLARDWRATPPTLAWHVPVGSGWCGFAVVNGVAITQEQRDREQLVVARNVETGAELWRHAHPAYFDHFLGGPGPRATPTIAHGRVYAQDALGLLQCLNGADGALLWQHDLRAEYGMTDALEEALVMYGRSGSALVLRDMVIVPAGGDPAGKRAGLAAFERTTGALVWEGPPRDISHSSPNVARLAGVEQVLIVNQDTVSGHDPRDGRLLWEHPWPGHTNGDANNSQPVPVPPDRVLVSKGYGQGAALLRLVPGEGGALSVEPVWAVQRALRTKLTNVVINGEHVYALSDGILECVALATGERVWRAGRYGHGQILLAGDLLLVLSEEGELALVEATPERENSVLGSVQAVTGKTWNTLALYRDLVLVRNGVEAAAWRVPLAR